jgi:hypothetical protein
MARDVVLETSPAPVSFSMLLAILAKRDPSPSGRRYWRNHRGVGAHLVGLQDLGRQGLDQTIASLRPSTADDPHRVVTFISVLEWGTGMSRGDPTEALR